MYPSIEIPEPLAFFFDKWHSDPLFRGSYSNWPASFFQEHHDNLRATVSERLWFAGEAGSQKYFGGCCTSLWTFFGSFLLVGFLHGAYFDGLDVGGEVAKCIKEGGCIGLQHVEEVKNARSYRV